MPRIIASEDALELVIQPLEPDGITENEFYVPSLFSVVTGGAWDKRDIKELRQMCRKQQGERPPNKSYISPEMKVNIGQAKRWVRFGNNNNEFIEVVDLPAFIELPIDNYEDNVPTYPDADGNPTFPRSTKTVDDVEVPRKWSEWKRQNMEHRVSADGLTMAIPTNSATMEDLAGSMILKLEQDGFDVKPMKQYPAAPDVV